MPPPLTVVPPPTKMSTQLLRIEKCMSFEVPEHGMHSCARYTAFPAGMARAHVCVRVRLWCDRVVVARRT